MVSLGLIFEGNPLRFHWTTSAVLCLLYLALIGSALTFLLLYWLLPRMRVNSLQTISLITPPGAVAIGWMLGGETFSLWQLLGGAFVLAGIWMIFGKAESVDVPTEAEAAMPRV
jgi:drug/metabolite transporter (DMT)-like permease